MLILPSKWKKLELTYQRTSGDYDLKKTRVHFGYDYAKDVLLI
jgi:hypothetical protein